MDRRLAQRNLTTGLVAAGLALFFFGLSFLIAVLYPFYLSRLFVYEVGVAPEARRRGVASELLRELERIARARGIRNGFVLTNEANEAAMELYRSLGGVRPNADDVLWDFDYDGG